jgi:hypothetical protein
VKSLAPFFIAALASQCASPARADHGQDALTILCDQRGENFELRLFILWNDELDAYLASHAAGASKEPNRFTKVFLDNRDKKFSRSCRLKSAVITLDLKDKYLSIIANKVPVVARRLDYRWFKIGRVYAFRLSKGKEWEQCAWIDADPPSCRVLENSEPADTEEKNAIGRWNEDGA